MNKRGFTLIEVIITISILILIITIAVPAITTLNKNQSKKQQARVYKTIENAAEVYVNNNSDTITNFPYSLDLNALISTGLLEDNIIDPTTNKKLSGGSFVLVEKIDNVYKYTYPYIYVAPPDNTPPVITFKSTAKYTIKQGTVIDLYTDYVESVTDDKSTTSLTISPNTIDTNVVGAYSVNYTATDGATNSVTETKIITVTPIYIYYSSVTDNLRRRMEDGTGDTAVVSTVIGTNILTTTNGWVYYTSVPGGHYGGINCTQSNPNCVADPMYLFRKKLDGSTAQETVVEVGDLEFFSGQDSGGNPYYSQFPSGIILSPDGNYIYYTDINNNLRKRNIDGTGDTAVVSTVIGTNIITTTNGWVYYTNVPGGHYGGINCTQSNPNCVADPMYLFRKKLDGSTAQETVIEVGDLEFFSGQDSGGNPYYSQFPSGITLSPDGNYIYYTDINNNLRKRNIDGTGDTAVVSTVIGTNILTTNNGWVYYTNVPGGHYGGINCTQSNPNCVADPMYLFRKKLDGSTAQETVVEVGDLEFFSGQDSGGNPYYSQFPSGVIYK